MDAVERALEEQRGIALGDADLLEVGAQRGDARTQQRVIDAGLERQRLPRHRGDEALVEIAQPRRARLQTLRRIIRHLMVVVVDPRLGRRDRMVLHEELDELLAQGREGADGLDHGRAPFLGTKRAAPWGGGSWVALVQDIGSPGVRLEWHRTTAGMSPPGGRPLALP